MAGKIEGKHLYGLDLLRFLLSVSILIVHFRHFNFPYTDISNIDIHILPFSSVLYFLYRFGSFAVEIFWMISGIIFFYFYLDTIADKKMNLFQFLGFRISRLYPLHIVTLVAIAVLQHFYINRHGTSFIYSNNDTLHFILNVLMVNFWNPKFLLSFNGPFWSVSAEMFVYIVFFMFAYMTVLRKGKDTISIAILFFAFYALGILSPFYECLLYFFTGCVIAQNFKKINSKWIITIISMIILSFLAKDHLAILQRNEYIIRIVVCFIKINIAVLLVYLFARGFSGVTKRIGKVLREFGNMTYSVYMIHISFQLISVLLFYKHGQSFFNSPLFFTGYLITTCAAGYLIYRLFEVPAQNYLRRKLKLTKPKNEAAAVAAP